MTHPGIPSAGLAAQPVTSLKGVGPKRALLLDRLGIRSIADLLTYYPRTYEDRRLAPSLARLPIGEKLIVDGEVRDVRFRRLPRRRSIVEATIADQTGELDLIWFNQPYMANQLKQGQRIRAFGKLSLKRKPFMASPQLLPVEQAEPSDIAPVYPATEGLSQTSLRNLVEQALSRFSHLMADPIPPYLKVQLSLPGLQQALADVHFPRTRPAMEAARKRLAFEEALIFQLGLGLQRLARTRSGRARRFSVTEKLNRRIAHRLPFALTPGQRRAIAEIQKDMASEEPMNRLLQGDVGSGKTLVAVAAMLTAVAGRSQAAIMAPTELLALQHYDQIQSLLRGSRVRVALCVGSLPQQEKAVVTERAASGEADIIVGTHALFQRSLRFHSLGLVVVDEQHRFGVLQRAGLAAKGAHPHVLVMTATPIPRTLALALFSDLDVSTIDDLPPGRMPVETSIVKESTLQRHLEFILGLVQNESKGFYVCPAVSSTKRRASVTSLLRQLKEGPLAGVPMAPLHGRLSWEERARVIERFRRGDLRLLVSSTVAEVGIDVPDASFILIDDARSFGLCQLHQLRGRVGRGGQRAYCLLIDRGGDEAGRHRLKLLTQVHDGFRISEADLQMRGPGDFFGVRQSGAMGFKMVDLVQDVPTLSAARSVAAKMLQLDARLERGKHADLRALVEAQFGRRIFLAGVA